MEKKYLGETGLARLLTKLTETFSKLGHKHTKSEITDFPTIPTKTSELTNDSGFKTTDNNTTYQLTKSGSTITLVGSDGNNTTVEDDNTEISVDSALSSSSTNPVQNKVINSALNGKVPTSRTVNGKALSANIVLSASDVGADASGTASSAVSSHNTSTSAHNDIRELITGLSTRLNALANSTDEDLDQMAEIVEYIKSNKSLIDSITTSKVNVADIVNNLTTNVSNKPLSAAQGVAIKALIDALQTEVDEKALASDLTNHTDNSTIHITSTERTNWNDANSKKHSHSNKSVLDGITSALITAWNNAVTHISDAVAHITATERANWNAAKTHADSAHAPSGAEVNQNAFSNVKVGTTTIAADSKTDTLELAGSNVTITPDATNDKVTIGITKENVVAALGYTPSTTDTKYAAAGTDLGLVKSGGDVTIADGVISVNDDSHNHTIANIDGLQGALDSKAASSHGTHVSYSTTNPVMDGTASVGSASTVARSDHKHPTDTSRASQTDLNNHVNNGDIHFTADERTKLAGIATGANKYSHPTHTARTSGLYKIVVDALGHVTGVTAVAKSDITALGIPSTNTIYNNATSSAAGLMPSTDKAKLDGMEIATVSEVETYLGI